MEGGGGLFTLPLLQPWSGGADPAFCWYQMDSEQVPTEAKAGILEYFLPQQTTFCENLESTAYDIKQVTPILQAWHQTKAATVWQAGQTHGAPSVSSPC